MPNKLKIAIFTESRNLSKQVLKKILILKKKVKIILIVSNVEFKKELKKNKIKNFEWVKNIKNNNSKIIKILKKYDSENIYAFSLQHKWRIEKRVIDNFKFFFNFHYGDIPKYRGHNPVIHAILNKEKYIYGTIHVIDKHLDKGLIVHKVKVKNNNISSKDIEDKITELFSDYFQTLALRLINKQKISLKKIKNKGKFYSYKDIQKLKEVKNIKEIMSKACAFDYPPHEPAYIKINKKKIYLKINLNSI